MSFSNSSPVQTTISHGVQAGKVSGAGARNIVALTVTTALSHELRSSSSDFSLCGDKMSCERGDFPSQVDIGSRQGNERRLIRGGGRREICESGSRLLLHL